MICFSCQAIENAAHHRYRLEHNRDHRFRRHLEDQGRREATIEGYLGNVNRHLKFARTDRSFGQDLERFRDILAERKVTRSTKNQYNYAIKAYYAMLGEKIEVKCPEPNNQIQHYFDSQDVISIFGVFISLNTLLCCKPSSMGPKGHRSYATWTCQILF